MKQARDFLNDSQQLFHLLKDKSDEDFRRKTQFKNWTIDDIIGHLHIFNFAAKLSIKSSDKFKTFFLPINNALTKGAPLLDIQNAWLEGLKGQALLETWWEEAQDLTQNFKVIDPKLRVEWAGPDMSARSSITARQMETWAHGQAVFDIFGKTRIENDRIKNIAHLGVLTFVWTFKNRDLEPPTSTPFVQLQSPSGEIWEWNDPSSSSQVKGLAVDFASVVTQTRNVLDTNLVVRGDAASQWMSVAQCFAGPPENPPEPNTRYPIV